MTHIKQARRWVLWVQEDRSGRPTKVPYTKDGVRARVNCQEDWSDYTTCCAALQENPQEFDGLGFVLGDGFVGVDLDNALGPKGLKPWAKQIFRALEKGRGLTYTEISPSGNGLHLIYTWDNPIKDGPTGRRFSPQPGTHFEVYLRNRYFTFTGKRFAPGKTPSEPQKAPEGLIALATLPSEVEIPPFEVVLAALRFGCKPLDVYLGQWKKYYPSASEAEQGLANYLSMIEVPKDAVSQLIMQSKIREPGDKKWEKRADYRERTLRKAQEVAQNRSDKGEKEEKRKPTDFENAKKIEAICSRQLLWDLDSGTWWIYRGGVWEPTDDAGVFALQEKVIAAGEPLSEEPDRNLQSASKFSQAVRCLRGFPSIWCRSGDFDIHREVICCPNGVVSFSEDGEPILGKHDPAKRLIRRAAVPYVPDAVSELWLETILPIFGEDHEAIDAVQLLCGYLALGLTTERSFFVAYGEGANGKSTFFETILYVLGSYGLKPLAKAIVDGPEDPKEALAELQGRRFLFLDEFASGRRLRQEVIKALASGDRIAARRLYGHPFEFQSVGKLVLAVNRKPRLSSYDQAIWDRLILIPFTQRFEAGQADRDRKWRLREPEEAQGILAWVIRGAGAYLRLRKQAEGGSVIPWPKSWLEEKESYREDEDPLAEWISSVGIKELPGEFLPRTRAWRSYNNWCEENKVRPVGRNTFYAACEMRWGKTTQKGGNRGWKNLTLGIAN